MTSKTIKENDIDSERNPPTQTSPNKVVFVFIAALAQRALGHFDEGPWTRFILRIYGVCISKAAVRRRGLVSGKTKKQEQTGWMAVVPCWMEGGSW